MEILGKELNWSLEHLGGTCIWHMYNLLNGTEHCMYSNCQSYKHVHVLKFCLTDQSLSKNGGKYFPAGKKERCTTVDTGKFNLLVLKTIHTHNRGQLESLLGGAKRGGGGPKYEAKC